MSAEPEHIFDKAEADALLPRLRELLGRLQEAATSESAVSGRRQLAQAGKSNGSPAAAAGAFRAALAIQEILDEVEATGVTLRDAATGLCDFPAMRGGEPIYLCWRLEEPEVSWWHPRDTGIAGREPL